MAIQFDGVDNNKKVETKKIQKQNDKPVYDEPLLQMKAQNDSTSYEFKLNNINKNTEELLNQAANIQQARLLKSKNRFDPRTYPLEQISQMAEAMRKQRPLVQIDTQWQNELSQDKKDVVYKIELAQNKYKTLTHGGLIPPKKAKNLMEAMGIDKKYKKFVKAELENHKDYYLCSGSESSTHREKSKLQNKINVEMIKFQNETGKVLNINNKTNLILLCQKAGIKAEEIDTAGELALKSMSYLASKINHTNKSVSFSQNYKDSFGNYDSDKFTKEEKAYVRQIRAYNSKFKEALGLD